MEYYLEGVKCKDLFIDHSYQRDIDQQWLRKIIKNYDQSQVRPLVLSRRKNGDLFILDGNHTRTATMEVLGDDAELPAKIYRGLTVEQEAELFNKLNTNSKKTSFNQNLKARYAAKEQAVVDYIKALNDSGIDWAYRSGGKAGPFVAHAAGMRFFQKYGENFIRACRVLKETDDRELYYYQILGGVCYLLKNTKLREEEITLTLKKVIKSDIEKRVRFYGPVSHDTTESTDKMYAMAILDYYNKGRRKKVTV